MAKRMAPADSSHRIGIITVWSDVLTAFWGGSSTGQKDAAVAGIFKYTATASGDGGKWMTPVDSQRRVGLNIRSHWILIVVGGSSSGD